MRTATSLNTFGFSVYNFFEILREAGGPKNQLIGARRFGLVLVGLGLASLALATVEYRQNISGAGSTLAGWPALTGRHRGGFDLNSWHLGLECDARSLIIPADVSSRAESYPRCNASQFDGDNRKTAALVGPRRYARTTVAPAGSLAKLRRFRPGLTGSATPGVANQFRASETTMDEVS
ncbi:MAG: DUF202 domain-containing protein [Deltaproteobacteria bacterium]|nr:DUF202 domain-containing protein [Deltaproteobacteria bacterium]